MSSSKKSSATLKALPALKAKGRAAIDRLLTGPEPACPAPPGAAPACPAWLGPPLLPPELDAAEAPLAPLAPPVALMPPAGRPLPAPALLPPALLLLAPALLAPAFAGDGPASELLPQAATNSEPVSSQALPSVPVPRRRSLELSWFMTGDLGANHE